MKGLFSRFPGESGILIPDSPGTAFQGCLGENSMKNLTHTIVDEIPECDFCFNPAIVDGKTGYGSWAHMCTIYFNRYGIGLGLGKGQCLILEKTGRTLPPRL